MILALISLSLVNLVCASLSILPCKSVLALPKASLTLCAYCNTFSSSLALFSVSAVRRLFKTLTALVLSLISWLTLLIIADVSSLRSFFSKSSAAFLSLISCVNASNTCVNRSIVAYVSIMRLPFSSFVAIIAQVKYLTLKVPSINACFKFAKSCLSSSLFSVIAVKVSITLLLKSTLLLFVVFNHSNNTSMPSYSDFLIWSALNPCDVGLFGRIFAVLLSRNVLFSLVKALFILPHISSN